MQLEGFGDIRTSKHWSHTQSLFPCLKCMLLLTAPSPRLFLAHENGERLGNQGKVLDESTVIIRQAQESTNSWHIDWCQDLLQNVHFSLVHSKTFWNNHMT